MKLARLNLSFGSNTRIDAKYFISLSNIGDENPLAVDENFSPLGNSGNCSICVTTILLSSLVIENPAVETVPYVRLPVLKSSTKLKKHCRPYMRVESRNRVTTTTGHGLN